MSQALTHLVCQQVSACKALQLCSPEVYTLSRNLDSAVGKKMQPKAVHQPTPRTMLSGSCVLGEETA